MSSFFSSLSVWSSSGNVSIFFSLILHALFFSRVCNFVYEIWPLQYIMRLSVEIRFSLRFDSECCSMHVGYLGMHMETRVGHTMSSSSFRQHLSLKWTRSFQRDWQASKLHAYSHVVWIWTAMPARCIDA